MARSLMEEWGRRGSTASLPRCGSSMRERGKNTLTTRDGHWHIAATVRLMVTLSRARKGFELYTPERAARGLIRGLRSGRWVGLMADVPEAGPTVVVPFCGGRVRVSAVPVRLAAATGTPIVPTACWREGSHWRLHIHAPIA